MTSTTCASPLNDRSVYPLYVLPLLTILFGVLLYVLLVLTNGNGNGNGNGNDNNNGNVLEDFLFVLFLLLFCATQILCTLIKYTKQKVVAFWKSSTVLVYTEFLYVEIV